MLTKGKVVNLLKFKKLIYIFMSFLYVPSLVILDIYTMNNTFQFISKQLFESIC